MDIATKKGSKTIETRKGQDIVDWLDRLRRESKDFDRYFIVKEGDSYTMLTPKRQNKNQQLQLGESTYTIPARLNKIADHIEESKEILTYPPDWDDEGAMATDESTFNKAAKFVINYSLYAYENSDVVLTPPYIDIMRDGAVSVYWESKKAHMHIIFNRGESELAYFYAEQKGKKVPVKSAIESSGAVDEFLMSWMRTYLK